MAGPASTTDFSADSRSPSARSAATRNATPSALMAREAHRRQSPERRGHQCMRRARAHASPIVTARVVTGAEGYHEPVTGEAAREAHEANDATRGSAIKLAAEVASRGLGLLTMVLVTRGLGVEGFGVFSGPFVV